LLQAFLRTYGRGLRTPATGADDAQADAIARVAPLVALFAGDPRLMQLTAAVTRVTQDTPTAVAWACAAAAVLERLLLGQGAAAAVQETAQELKQEGPAGVSEGLCRWALPS
jgi:ADP-ribosylglycohydrolase